MGKSPDPYRFSMKDPAKFFIKAHPAPRKVIPAFLRLDGSDKPLYRE